MNIDVNRDDISLVVIERFQEGESHLVQHEAANERPQDSERVGSRVAREPDAGENPEDEASQRLAFTTPFRRIRIEFLNVAAHAAQSQSKDDSKKVGKASALRR